MFWRRSGTIILAMMLPSIAFAQTNCSDRESIVTRLEAGYGEAFAGGGLRNAQQVFEVWMSEEKGTWTILMTRSDGKSCIMASGTNWRDSTGVKLPKGIPG